jgi:FtsZ-binding cell division protein ZapB
MSEDKIAEIERLTRERDEARAEVERLRVENEELRKERDTAQANLFSLSFHFENWKVYNGTYQIEELRAENEKLRAEMLDLVEWCEAEEPLSHKKLSYRLRYALEGKP